MNNMEQLSVNVNAKTEIAAEKSDLMSSNSNINLEESSSIEDVVSNVDELVTRSRRNAPTDNVPEKIVFCVDVCDDADGTSFEAKNGAKYKSLFMIKKTLASFMSLKNFINRDHQYALMLLQSDRAVWIRNFTNIAQDILSDLDMLREDTSGETFDLTSVFDVLQDHVAVPKADELATFPVFSLRMIFIYNRTNCIPQFLNGRDSFNYFSSSDYFTFDVIYIHDEISKNKCKEVFNALSALDERRFSYMFNVAKNATKLHDDMAKLMAHPFQRPSQSTVFYKFPEKLKQ